MNMPIRFLSGVNSPTSEEPPDTVTVDSDFVVILAALLCALICVVGLVAVARCTWLRRGSASGPGRSTLQPPANKGLKKKILRSLPKLSYNSTVNGKLADCAICLTEFDDGDEIRVLPQCDHGFHVSCIDTWLGSHSSCPSCRQILVVARCQNCGDLPVTSCAGAQTDAREVDVNRNIPRVLDNYRNLPR
ncbi:hypothetical protein HHK36_008821 [Tetracentron sinense]|uniref:RING-type E3 ubiquitin transferase n=1 Tax=Tetracentron sinense TaxID=13715 RepID=A0A835DNQ0_TETSI|nr:hypothetical protein HHK36_008821 [Tetracentron sinense]